jgi:UDP-N-acetylglucosamine diphosphorylase/glucosamine-1-phosphate N-acetyltransferase
MIEKPLNICILAAGKGTRMNSSLPKVLHEINNKPLINHVIETSMSLSPEKIIAIIGYKKELVKQSISKYSIDYAYQEEQKGTAHAIEQCLEKIQGTSGNTLVLSGDVPFISKETLDILVSTHNRNNSLASLISAKMENPSGYGRIVRDDDNKFTRIVEHKDANSEQLDIMEINSGIYMFDSEILCEKILLIKNNNNQQEYYLTDIFDFVDKDRISVIKTSNVQEINGINTLEQLKNIAN